MMVSDPAQAKVFGINILFGMALVMIYDIFRAVRRTGGKSGLYVNLMDITYFVFAFFAIFFAGVKYNFGALRYYQIMGLLAGAFIQIALFSRFEVRLFEALIKAGKAAVKFLIKVVLFIPIRVIRLLIAVSDFLEEKTVSIFNWAARKRNERRKKKQKNKKIIKKRIKML